MSDRNSVRGETFNGPVAVGRGARAVQQTAPRVGASRPVAPEVGIDEPFVMISYARADEALVRTLADQLRAAGVAPWYDLDVAPGEPWTQRLEQRLAACRALLVVMTEAARASDWVGREVRYVQRRGGRVVPVLVPPPDEPPFWLDDIQHERLTADGLLTERVVEALLAAVR